MTTNHQFVQSYLDPLYPPHSASHGLEFLPTELSTASPWGFHDILEKEKESACLQDVSMAFEPTSSIFNHQPEEQRHLPNRDQYQAQLQPGEGQRHPSSLVFDCTADRFMTVDGMSQSHRQRSDSNITCRDPWDIVARLSSPTITSPESNNFEDSPRSESKAWHPYEDISNSTPESTNEISSPTTDASGFFSPVDTSELERESVSHGMFLSGSSGPNFMQPVGPLSKDLEPPTTDLSITPFPPLSLDPTADDWYPPHDPSGCHMQSQDPSWDASFDYHRDDETVSKGPVTMDPPYMPYQVPCVSQFPTHSMGTQHPEPSTIPDMGICKNRLPTTSDHSGTTYGRRRRRLSEGEKKRNRTVSEKQRREDLRNRLDEICSMIPGLHSNLGTKSYTLKRIADSIETLLNENQSLRKYLDSLPS